MKIRTIIIGRSIGLVVLYCLIAGTTVFSQTASERKPSLAVIEFEVRTQASRDVGRELSDMLVNALLETQRFTIVDRSRTNLIQEEQLLALRGNVSQATGAEVGKMLGAQFLVLGSVTEFSEKKSGGAGSVFNRVPLANKLTSYQAVVKFNLKAVNSTTGELVFSQAITKEVKSTGLGGDGTVFGVPMGEGFESKAMQDAVVQAMRDAVALLVERIGSFTPPPGVVVAGGASAGSAVDCSHVVGSKAPKVMVVIPEVHLRQRIPDPAGETEIIKKLVERRFNVVDQRQVAAIRDREKVLTAIRNPQAAAALGAEFGADIIIIGEAFSELAGRERNMISSRARVEARAIQTDTARILAAEGTHGSGLDITEFVSAKAALRNAGSQWADYFIVQICQAPKPNEPTSSAVEILISNVSYAQLKLFTDSVAKISGVRSVEKKLTDNVARVSVQYDGSAERLADSIAETRFGTMRVNIVGLSGNKIEISVGR